MLCYMLVTDYAEVISIVVMLSTFHFWFSLVLKKHLRSSWLSRSSLDLKILLQYLHCFIVSFSPYLRFIYYTFSTKQRIVFYLILNHIHIKYTSYFILLLSLSFTYYSHFIHIVFRICFKFYSY